MSRDLRVLLCGLVLSADALRSTKKTSRFAPGMVDNLYTFGAPGTANPGFKNAHAANGCFPGVRIWNSMQTKDWMGREKRTVDHVVPLPGMIGYRHTKMQGFDLNWNESRLTQFPCSDDLTREPTGAGDDVLHEPWMYIWQVEEIIRDSFFRTMAMMGAKFSYGHVGDKEFLAEAVKELGWRLVGQGFDDGSANWAGGQQVSNLFQNPSNLNCILTFQGTYDSRDWFANLDVRPVSFCGREEWVHAGFRDHLRRITRNESWQSEVRPHLVSCGALYVTGHSLGGAMAEMFTACAANPAVGGEASEDYNFIGWLKGTPARLPYL